VQVVRQQWHESLPSIVQRLSAIVTPPRFA
jgi:hypothetical protein